MSVLIIGAGLGGLSAAMHLAGQGHEVTVLERACDPGGLMGRWHSNGYRFDTGPTVLTMPGLIEECFAAVGESMKDWLELSPLDPAYRAEFADGTVIHSHPDIERMSDEVARVCGPNEARGYRELVAWLGRLFDVEFDTYMGRNLDSLLDLVRPQGIALMRLGGLRSLEHAVSKYLTDERLIRLFTFQAMYAGMAPARARAIYGVISYLDSVAGVWFPKGGMYAVAAGLEGAATKHGVSFRYGTEVTAIEVSAGRARAVRTADGERIEADAVIYNGDLAHGYADLLTAQVRPPRLVPRRRRYSPSAVLWHVGTSGRGPQRAHHTISFGTAWSETFDELINRGQLMSDPSLLITNPTFSDPALAPEGRHTFYVLAPCPNLDVGGIDWASIGPRYLEELQGVLAARGFDTDGAFTSGVETQRLVTPAFWAASGLTSGTPFALAHTVAQTGPLRHPTQHPSVPNLLFCGAGAQPGIGVPTVLLSGRLAASRLGHG